MKQEDLFKEEQEMERNVEREKIQTKMHQRGNSTNLNFDPFLIYDKQSIVTQANGIEKKNQKFRNTSNKLRQTLSNFRSIQTRDDMYEKTKQANKIILRKLLPLTSKEQEEVYTILNTEPNNLNTNFNKTKSRFGVTGLIETAHKTNASISNAPSSIYTRYINDLREKSKFTVTLYL